jgi:hypothetical protein
MTDNDFAQLAALRMANTAAALRAVGFQVLSVKPVTFGWRVNLSIIPKTEKTLHDRCRKAGYHLRRHGTDSSGLFMIVE